MTLSEFFKEHPRAALAFSGGADSSYLLYAARQAGAQVQPYFVKTAFQPQFELHDAQRLCDELGVELMVLYRDVLSHDEVCKNPADRCYHCKRVIFEALLEQAARDGYDVVLDGTNASDDAGDRPGMRALAELCVYSPLRECGLTKDEIRRRSKAAGLFTHDKPAYACLATRIPTGVRITQEDLSRIESAEDILFAMGFSDLRVRLFHDAARIQLPTRQFSRAVKLHDEIESALGNYFPAVLLDLKGR